MFWAGTDFFKDASMRIRNRFNIWTIRDRGFLLKMTVVPVVDQRDDLRPHGPVMDDFLSVSTKRKTCSFPWFISSGNWKKMKELKVNFQQWDGGLSWQALQSAITPHWKCLFPRRHIQAAFHSSGMVALFQALGICCTDQLVSQRRAGGDPPVPRFSCLVLRWEVSGDDDGGEETACLSFTKSCRLE